MIVFYVFAMLQVFLGYKSLQSGLDYLRYFKKEFARKESDFSPFVSLIIPCRGLDKDLKSNLLALFQQDYPNYELVFVVDSENDEALKIIKNLINHRSTDEQKIKNSVSACLRSEKIVIAGKASESGQKVHNLRKAVLEVSDESKVFVFVDSDARPDKNWLKYLVAPLKDEKYVCATGYRWFVQKKGRFATHLRSVWNASIASALGENDSNNFCWGGSTAIRRKAFENLNIREKWTGTLSDDFALTNALKEAKLPIYFVPQCLTATVEDCSFGELLEFTTRQMKITRVYSPNHFKVSFIGSILFSLTFWIGVILLFFVSGFHFWLTLLFLLIIFILGTGKAWIRFNAVKLALKNYEKQINKQFFPQILLWTISPILFLYNNLIAVFSRKIIWRGIEYELKSPTKTVIINRNVK